MAILDDLKTWFERDIRFATWGENVKVVELEPDKFEVFFYTDTNEYRLTLVTEGDDPPRLDATVRSRKPRAGQTASRVRSLLPARPGQSNERIWRRILGAIVGLELVRVHRQEAGEAAEPVSAAGEGAELRRRRNRPGGRRRRLEAGEAPRRRERADPADA
jgi:hypothetical protein